MLEVVWFGVVSRCMSEVFDSLRKKKDWMKGLVYECAVVTKL
jgi:hypothetical protein